MSITADFSELNKLLADLDRAERDIDGKSEHIIDRVAAAVKADAEAGAPVDSGELRASLSISGQGSNKNFRQRSISSNVRQAAFLEYGSPTTGAPRPWLSGPAWAGSRVLYDQLAKAGDVW